MADRTTEVHGFLDALQTHLDNTVSLACVKLIWLHRIRFDNQSYSVDLVDTDTPTRFVTKMVATADQLRSHCEGFVTEIRRTFINDLYLAVSRHSVLAKNVITSVEPPQPEFHEEPNEGEITALARFLTKDDKKFLEFFRRLRNSTVHYDGNHNRRNSLDFTFDGTHFHTTEANLGHQIGYWFAGLFAIHTRFKEIFTVDKILSNPHFRRLLGTE